MSDNDSSAPADATGVSLPDYDGEPRPKGKLYNVSELPHIRNSYGPVSDYKEFKKLKPMKRKNRIASDSDEEA
jgi:hypothetical protein